MHSDDNAIQNVWFMISIQNKLEKLNELQKNDIDYGMKPSSIYCRLFSPVHNALADIENE
jgi:hypothetical protein